MDIKDIDKHLSASGVLKLIEMKKAQSKAKLPNLLRIDGTAKKRKCDCSAGDCAIHKCRRYSVEMD